jgi:hypothetical protein
MASVKDLNLSSKDESIYYLNQWELLGSSSALLILFPFTVELRLLLYVDGPKMKDLSGKLAGVVA